MDTAVARHRKPVPKPRANSDTPPTKPLSLSKISTSGADKQPLQYTGPVGPWFPSSPTSSDDDKNSPLPPPTELQGLSATKPNTYCISDDITRRPSVAHRHGFNPEHEVSCISDDMQNGSLCSEKLALPPEFFGGRQVPCLSNDLAKAYKGLGEEGEEELLAQMEKEERSRTMERERVCLGDELAEWHTDRSGLIPVIEEEECETPSHTHTYAAGIPVMVEEADARR
ncbi:hypothetical protein L873DRAFT_1827161 [Choiromyces venosus 120613-1]|uniref:Uncharacterized protein n=1 Tax=Choiromyces venosus 120613-1 TaxID=1336337 RepID=A0A3N4JTG3_9PEZI|nr:hypothetical protein L873DRAFT_1827161 [Choiromyces venosus 120613-1]